MRAFECFYRLNGENGTGRTAIVLLPDNCCYNDVKSAIANQHGRVINDIKDFGSIALNQVTPRVYRLP